MPDTYATARSRAIGIDAARRGSNAVVALAFSWMLAATYHLLWLAADSARAQPILLANAACISLACWALVSRARWSRYSIILVASYALADLVIAYGLAASAGPGAMRAVLGGAPVLIAGLSIHTGSPWFGAAEVGVWCAALVLLNHPEVRRTFHTGKQARLNGSQAAIALLLLGLQVPGMVVAGAVGVVRHRLHVCRDHRAGATCPYAVAPHAPRVPGSAAGGFTDGSAPLPLSAPEGPVEGSAVGPPPRLPCADAPQPTVQRRHAGPKRLALHDATGQGVADSRIAPVKAHGVPLQRAAQGIRRSELRPGATDVAPGPAVRLHPNGDPLVKPARRASLSDGSHTGVRHLMQAG